MPASPKPLRGTAKRQKAKRKRQESKHALLIRGRCALRDGSCIINTGTELILQGVLSPCAGPSEWAHIGRHRRCHTRGQAPEARHTTAGSAMLCKRHHAALDAHEFEVEPLTERGMDGPFRVVAR